MMPKTKGIIWVKPVKVAEVEFATITTDGLLRQASFKGLREDKDAKSVVLEPHPELNRGAATMAAKPATRKVRSGDPEISGITITHPSKILWPESKLGP